MNVHIWRCVGKNKMPELLGVYCEEGTGHGQQGRRLHRWEMTQDPLSRLSHTDESLTWKPERTVFRCVSPTVSHGSSELTLNPPRLKELPKAEKMCSSHESSFEPMSSEERRTGFKVLTLGVRVRDASSNLVGTAGSSHLPPRGGQAFNILLQFHKQSGGGTAPAWLEGWKGFPLWRRDSWHACSEPHLEEGRKKLLLVESSCYFYLHSSL